MIPSLIYSIAGGMLVVLAAGKPAELSWRYLRTVAVIVLAISLGDSIWILRSANLSLLHTSAFPVWAGLGVSTGAVLLLFLAPLAAGHPSAYRGISLLAGLSGIAAATGFTWSGASSSQNVEPPALAVGMIVVSQALGACLLGSITVSWLLGHAYLTATKMTINPLRRFARLLMAAVLARAAFLVVSAVLGWLLVKGGPTPGGSEAPVFVDLIYRSWLIVFLRVGLGIIGVGVFSFMVLDCVRLRSTQSATGILYFGSIFAYIGELASQYLLYEWKWPI